MEQAITPDINEINKEVRSSDIEVKEDKTGNEIAALKQNKGWMEIEGYIQGRLKQIELFEVTGLSMEEVGYRHMLTLGITQELEAILNIIDAHDEQRKEKRREGGTKD